MGAGGGVVRGGLVAERAVPSAVVVVLLPVADHDPGLGQAPEDVDVQAFVADAAVERLDVAVAPWFAGRDEVQPDAFAGLCGVAPIPASSGKTTRHRLHRGGDRSGNRALHIAVIVRLRYDLRSRAYATRRTTHGKSKPEIIGCQKRYLAREVFSALRADYAAITT